MYQGMAMRAEGTPVINLEPIGTVGAIKGRLDCFSELNLKHLESHKSYQLEL